METFPSGRYTMGGTDFPFRPNTGNAFANFLLGNVSNATFTQAQAQWQPRWWSHSFYIQDDYKWKPNITRVATSMSRVSHGRPIDRRSTSSTTMMSASV